MQTAIPYVYMRGGSSKGPYFNRADLPQHLDTLEQVLIAVIGAGHGLNIDGIGGGHAITTKVAMLSISEDEWADIDYFFAQVSVDKQTVDFKPTCGNILSGVASAAIEMGLIKPQKGITKVNIKAVNTGAKVEAIVTTPNGFLSYDGETRLDGVPNSAAPVLLNFMDVAGSGTGHFLPTGKAKENINGIEVTCMDVAMPMVLATAASFGLTGKETVAELNNNRTFFDRMEPIRLAAGRRMGLGDCSNSVIPKFAMLSTSSQADLCARYFMPFSTHPTLPVTGSQCIAACALTPNTIATDLLSIRPSSPATLAIEHPSGAMSVVTDFNFSEGQFEHVSAGLIRTCRKLAQGHVFIPTKVWNNENSHS